MKDYQLQEHLPQQGIGNKTIHDFKHPGRLMAANERVQIYFDRVALVTDASETHDQFNRAMLTIPGNVEYYQQQRDKNIRDLYRVIKKVDFVLSLDDFYRKKASLPKSMNPTYIPTATDLETMDTMAVLSHADTEAIDCKCEIMQPHMSEKVQLTPPTGMTPPTSITDPTSQGSSNIVGSSYPTPAQHTPVPPPTSTPFVTGS